MAAQWTYAVDKVTVTGGIYSRTTSRYVVGANVAILTKDSALLTEGKAEKESWRFERDRYYYDSIGVYKLEIEKKPEDYILRVTKDGFEPKFVNFTLKDMGAREFEKKLPNIYLSPERKSVDLDEVVVQATKVKFYNRGSVNADPSKSLFYFKEGGANVEYSSANNKLQTSLSYIYSTKLADLVDMVDIVNDTDPLNIQLGNPDLKIQSEHSVFINANYSMLANARLWFYGGLSIYDNQIVRGYRYDTATGIRTFKSYNVNGSSNLNLYLNYSRDLWLNGLSGSVALSYDWNRYADMVGENSDPVKQQVLNQAYSCSVNLGYHNGIFDARIHTSLRWGRDNYQRLNSVSNTFNTYNSASINLELPKNFSIGTDLNFLTRDGYLENQMNSHDWLWNAEVRYKLKDAWTFSVRGYDILNQMKSIQYSVNAQGRTQEMYNILPRFVMLTVKYNFDFKPKKHK